MFRWFTSSVDRSRKKGNLKLFNEFFNKKSVVRVSCAVVHSRQKIIFLEKNRIHPDVPEPHPSRRLFPSKRTPGELKMFPSCAFHIIHPVENFHFFDSAQNIRNGARSGLFL